MLHGTIMIDAHFKCETQEELEDLRKNVVGAVEKQTGIEDAEISDEDVNDTADETPD